MVLKVFFLFIMMLGGALLAPPKLFAQNDSLLQSDFSFMKYSDPWQTGWNAAGLQRLGNVCISDVCLSLSGYDGGFVSYNEAPKAFEVDVKAESFYRLNSRLALYGMMIYQNLSARQMAGSAFINPWHMPFDIVEDSLVNIGGKHLDTYNLAGGMSYKIGRRLSLGMKIDFRASNYAKYKDLRHKNNLMDMTMTAGAYSPIGSFVQLGANLYYRRNTESIRFATYGNADKVYKSFIDYGAFVGRVEQFGEGGYTDKNKENPFFSGYVGFGLQIGIDITNSLVFYNSINYLRRDGYYGRKSSYSISYNQHNSNGCNYIGRLSYRHGSNYHHLNASVETESLKNFANSYRSTTNPETNAAYYEYFTPIKLADKRWVQMDFSYKGQYGIKALSSIWDIKAGVRMFRRKITVYQYPYYRNQTIASNCVFVEGERNFIVRRGMITAKVGFSYLDGNNTPYEDGTYILPAVGQTPPPTMEPYFWREYCSLTAPQFTLSSLLRYSFAVTSVPLKMYIEPSIIYKKANVTNEYLLGKHRTIATIAIGCIF